ncbi:MAG: exodeoxyribonuclease III [Micrococcales bacterium]|nr:exodeoxyribonuclease III [Micrococcales bacterium]
MRIATWNVNSVRARLDRVLAYLESHDVDVLALQETKVHDDGFPTSAFASAGYEVATWGVSQWNGVALASRLGIAEVRRGFPGQVEFGDPSVLEARAVGGVCGGVRVWSVYVPHGRGPDDPHMTYKLDFLRGLGAAASEWLAASPSDPVAVMGDFNVAPLDTDVWDASLFRSATHVSPAERAALGTLEEAGLVEVSRRFIPEPGVYTQWDYRALRFPRNEGMRIDFVYCSPGLVERVRGAAIVRNERKGSGASDHVPVEIDVAT